MNRFRIAARRTFQSLHTSRNFRLYLFGQVISASGTWVNATASAWLVLQLTHSGVALGVNVALLFLPILIFGAWGGVLADKFNKRRILVWTQTAFAVTAFLMFAIVVTHVDKLWMVYVLSTVAGFITAIDNPTRQSFYVEIVGEKSVMNAVSLNSAAFTGARIIGPAIAGILISTFEGTGTGICFLVDGISYLAVITALLMMRTSELHPQKRTTRESGHLKAGIQYVWRTDALRRPLILMTGVFTLSFNFAVLLPLLAKQSFGGNADALGLLSAMVGVGSLIGALTVANRDRTPNQHRLAVLSVATGVALAVSGIAPTLVLAAAAMIPVGFTVMAFMITGNTMLQLHARPQARGRVMALYGVVFLGSTPIGAPIAGWVGEHFTPGIALIAGGAAAALFGLLALRQRQRQLGTVSELTTAPEQVPGVENASLTA
jgi:MFS family permease